MARFCGVLAIGALGPVTAVTSSTPAAAAELVTFVDTTATLPAEDTTRVSFPLTPAAEVELDALSISVVRVRRGEVEIPAPPGLAARVDPDLQAVVLDIPADRLERQGTYSLLTALREGAARQLVTLTVTRPAGVLTAPAAVRVERTTPLPLINLGEKTVTPKVTLLASSDSRILSLSFRQREAEDPQVEAEICAEIQAQGDDDGCQTPVPVVERDESVELDYEVTGDTAPGTVTRTVDLTSPQLTQPATVTFTIVTRRSPSLIALALLIGVLLALVLRYALPKLAAWVSSQRARNDLLEQFDVWEKKYADNTFRKSITEHADKVRTAKGSDLTKTITDARTAADQALQDLKTRITQQDARSRAAVSVLSTTWRVPSDEAPVGLPPQPGIATALAAARADLHKADGALTTHDADNARDALNQMETNAGRLVKAADAWGAQVRQSLAGLRDLLQECDRGALGNLKLAITAAILAAPQKPADPAADTDTVSAARIRLQMTHDTTGAYAAIRPLLADLAEEADTVADILSVTSGPLTAAADRLRATDAGHDPARTGVDVEAALRRVVETARSAILTKAGASSNSDLQNLLKRGALVEASHSALTAQDSRLGGESEWVSAALPSNATPPMNNLPLPPPTQARPPITDWLRRGPSLEQLMLVSGLGLLLHLLMVVIVVLITGYALFLPNWTGSGQDLLKVLAWGFTVDLSVAGLTALITSQRAGATVP